MILETSQLLSGLAGGVIIGFAVTLMLLFNGRVTGISGITYGLFNFGKDSAWRAMFLLGMFSGGLFLQFYLPESLENTLNLKTSQLVIAGLLVGFGTLLGNGCTSGHGVCGISRFSLRSITATITFMTIGILTVYLVKNLFNGGL